MFFFVKTMGRILNLNNNAYETGSGSATLLVTSGVFCTQLRVPFKQVLTIERSQRCTINYPHLRTPICSVPDPKLIISDPDPQIENQEFRIRIQIRILLWTSDGEKKFSILVNNKTLLGWNLQLFEFFKNCIWNYGEFFHFLGHF